MKPVLCIAASIVLAAGACGGSGTSTDVIVHAATGPSSGGADIQYFGMLLFVDGEIPAGCPDVTEFQATLGPPHTVTGALNFANPVNYTHAGLADVNNTASWDSRQVSNDEVFPMLPVGSQVMLCTYPLDGSLQALPNCTIGSESGVTTLGILELTGESSCTTPQAGGVVGNATGNNSPTLNLLNADLTACADNIDEASTGIEILDPDGDDVELTVSVISAPPGSSPTVQPNTPITVASGATVDVRVTSIAAGPVELRYDLVDALGLPADGPFLVTMNFNACP